MIPAYIHGGSGLLRYLGHYLVARGLFQLIDRLGAPAVIVIGLALCLAVSLVVRWRHAR